MDDKHTIYGLVLTGGKSRRMKQDKALLNFHGKTQTEYCYGLLTEFCQQVFISNRKDQEYFSEFQDFPQIHDAEEYCNIGPLGGILTAMKQFPPVSWLVLACDLPFVDHQTIAYLIKNRNLSKEATTYLSSYDQLPEPLCAIYEPRSRESLLKFFHQGVVCPRKILINSDIESIEQIREGALDNINNPKEYEHAMAVLKKRKGGDGSHR